VVTAAPGRSSLRRQRASPIASHLKVGGDQIALVSHVKGMSQKDAAALMLGQAGPGTVTSTVRGTSTVQDKFPPLDYLEADHITVEALGLSQETAEALGIGYARRRA
jgi:hypothetical protein